MARGVSQISITLGATNTAGPVFAQYSNQIQQLGQTAQRTARQMQGIVPGSNMQAFSQRQVLGPLQQLSFGIEDFLAVYQTSGVTGGLRAAANNISMAASIINPALGIGLGIGASVLPLAIREIVEGMNETASSAEIAQQNIAAIRDRMKEVADEQARIRSFSDIFDGRGSALEEAERGDAKAEAAAADAEDARLQQGHLRQRRGEITGWMQDTINRFFNPNQNQDPFLFAQLQQDFTNATSTAERFRIFQQMEEEFDVGNFVDESQFEGLGTEIETLTEEFADLQKTIDDAADAQRRNAEAQSDPAFQARLEAEALEHDRKLREERLAEERRRRDSLQSSLASAASLDPRVVDRELELFAEDFSDAMAAASGEAERVAIAEKARRDLEANFFSRIKGDADPFSGKSLGSSLDPRTAAGVSYLNRFAFGNLGGRSEREVNLLERINETLREIRQNTEASGTQVELRDIGA